MRLWLSALLASVGILAAAGENLALKKSVKASSRENTRFLPEFSVDGKTRTRWSSQQRNDPQWLMVDLGAVKKVGKVLISWEEAAAEQYRIQLSLDGKSWKDVARKTAGAGGVEELKFSPESARYVRMLGEKRRTKGGYSIFEFEVYSE